MNKISIKKIAQILIFILPAFLGISGFFLMNISLLKIILIILFLINLLYLFTQKIDKDIFNNYLIGILFLMPLLIPNKDIATLTSSKIVYIYINLCNGSFILY